jgi:hypothetical protein
MASRERKRAYSRRYHAAHRVELNARRRAWRCARPIAVQDQERAQNRDRMRVYNAVHRVEVNARMRARYAVNPTRIRLDSLFARDYQRVATPPWAIEYLDLFTEIVRNCPAGYQIDHIVPIGGRSHVAYTPEGYKVSGLNVPWNIRYLSKPENPEKAQSYGRGGSRICIDPGAAPAPQSD